MLGPVSGADVAIVGTGGTLGTGTTGPDGRFGPIDYPGSYEGPLRITVAGNTSSQWICDYYDGCPIEGSHYPFGSSIQFSGELEAVTAGAGDGDFVSVSMLSNFVAERMDVLGGLSAANVDQANADIRETIKLAIGDILDTHAGGLTGDISSIELFDIANPPAPGGTRDALSLLLSIFNSGLMGLSEQSESTRTFIESLSDQVALQPFLPLSHPTPPFNDPSQAGFLNPFVNQVTEIGNTGATAAMNALLAPDSIETVAATATDAYLALPDLLINGGARRRIAISDVNLGSSFITEVSVETSSGASIDVADIGVRIIDDFAPSPWLTATPIFVGGELVIWLNVDTAAVETFPNGSYEAHVQAYSTDGNYLPGEVNVRLEVDIAGTQIEAGGNPSRNERDNVMLHASTNRPNYVDTIAWTQVAGPSVVITDSDTFTPTVALPSLDASDVATLELRVDFTTGEVLTDRVDINIAAYLHIADFVLPDPTLEQCVSDAAAAGSLIETIEVTALICAGVSDATGLNAFPNIATLDLSGNSLSSLEPIRELASLEFLDLSGNASLNCVEVDELPQYYLVEGTTLIVDNVCIGSDSLELGAEGFDTEYDVARNQLYVSIPDRNEVAVVSLDQRRIVDRLLLPGRPLGIDLSIDGTRVFAALNGSNAVAVIDIDQRTVGTIDLGTSPDNPLTYDVVEAAPDRLIVSAGPGSGGFSYISQVRLNQSNLVTRVASDRIIRARPVLERSPDQQFVYVGEGFSPNSLYKLSLLEADAPIVLDSAAQSDNLVLNSTGTRIALGSGRVLTTDSFIEEGRVSSGPSSASNTTNTLFVARGYGYVAEDYGLVETFDFDTLTQTGSIITGCDVGRTSQIDALSDENSFALLQSRYVCLYGSRLRSAPVDPFSELRFQDLALEECIIAAAVSAGYTVLEEFTALDCSTTPKTILGLDGIESMSNLQSLNLDNSGVSDLQPLASLAALQTLSLISTSVSDITPLFDMVALDAADLSGNPRVLCRDFDDLANTGRAVAANQCTDAMSIELGGTGHDMEFDAAADRAFVSIPSLNRISEIDLSNASITNNLSLPAQPRGIDLAGDGTTIYAALSLVGDLAVIDSLNGNVESIDISSELDNDQTWDVAEVSTDRVVVSTNPGDSGLGYIVEVRRDLGNAASRVASNEIIRAAPNILVSPDQTAVYVGSGFSSNSLYKLDATQADLPIILEDDVGSVSGTDQIALSPDGTRVFLRSGQVLDASTFTQVALFPGGLPLVSQNGALLLVGDLATDAARVYSLSSTAQVDVRPWGCNVQTLSAMFEYGNGILALGDDLVCYSRTVTYPR